MSRARWIYKNTLWRDRAIKFARSLKGRPRTPDEQEWRDTHPDKWDYFLIYGVQPETQAYVNETIRQLENLDTNDLGDAVITEIRLKWSARELLKKEDGGG